VLFHDGVGRRRCADPGEARGARDRLDMAPDRAPPRRPRTGGEVGGREMIVTAKLFGTLHRFESPGFPGLWRGSLPSGSTVRDVVQAIGADEREVAAAALNGVMTPLDTTVPPDADL